MTEQQTQQKGEKMVLKHSKTPWRLQLTRTWDDKYWVTTILDAEGKELLSDEQYNPAIPGLEDFAFIMNSVNNYERNKEKAEAFEGVLWALGHVLDYQIRKNENYPLKEDIERVYKDSKKILYGSDA